jgi:hypothetical protein
MPFMVPEYFKGVMLSVENRHGETVARIPLIDPSYRKLAEDAKREEGKGATIKSERGHFCHLTAPGYMDQTEWDGPFKTLAEARQHIIDFHEVDPDTGEELGAEEEQDEDEGDGDDDGGDLASQAAENVVISDASRGGYDVSRYGKHRGHEVEWDDAFALAGRLARDGNVQLDIFYVNDHGNISLLDERGREIKSRV